MSVAVASTLALSLAGCAPETATEPTSAATATATATPDAPYAEGAEAPASEDDAITAAKAVTKRFVELTNASTAAGEVDVAAMDEVAIDPALSNQIASAETVRSSGYVVTGETTLEILSAYATDVTGASGAALPFGSVELSGCFDISGRTITLADGSAAPSPPESRSLRDINVVFNTDNGGWRVRSFTTVEGTC